MTTMGIFHHIPPWNVLALICAVLLLITLIPLGRFRKHRATVKKISKLAWFPDLRKDHGETRDSKQYSEQALRVALPGLGTPMLVRDIMTTDLTTLREDETMLDANLIFARAGIHHLPIMNDTHLVGLVTDKDLKHYSPSILSGLPVEEYNRLMDSTPLSKIMTRTLLTIEPGKTVREAAQILADRRIGCLPVVEGSELKGIITTRDLVKVLLHLLKEL